MSDKTPLHEKVIDHLPERFTPTDLKKIIYRLGYSPDSFTYVLAHLQITEQVERVERGVYQPINQPNHA